MTNLLETNKSQIRASYGILADTNLYDKKCQKY